MVNKRDVLKALHASNEIKITRYTDRANIDRAFELGESFQKMLLAWMRAIRALRHAEGIEKRKPWREYM